MHLFSLSMRSLYCEEKVSASVENGKEFISLRDATRDDAVAYLRGVMPLNETCLMKLQEYFSYYECLKFDEWKECVPDILEEVEDYREVCQALVEVHGTFLVILKKRQSEATELCCKFKNLQVKYDKEVSELRKRAESRRRDKAKAKKSWGWAVGLMMVPGVSSIASSFFGYGKSGKSGKSGNSYLDKAIVVKSGQKEKIFAAIRSVSDILVPALKEFIKGLEIISGFFNIVHRELAGFDSRMEDKKRVHYLLLKTKAREIKAGCRAFHGVLPAVKTDFQAIPTVGLDESYVASWLKKQKTITDEHCKDQSREIWRKTLKAVKC